MTQFRYQALNANQDVVAGEIEAESVSQAIARLEADGLIVQSIAAASYEIPAASALSLAHGSDSGDLAVERDVLRPHMTRALERGKVLVPALAAYAEELPRGRRRQELMAVVQVMERGDVDKALDALQEVPEYWIPLLSSAATSGDPAHMFQEVFKDAQRADEMRQGWTNVFAYFFIMACLTAAVFVLLSVTVIPKFEQIFMDFGLRLPWMTLAVLRLAKWITNGQALVAAGVLFVVVASLMLALRRWRISVSNRPSALLGRRFGRSIAVVKLAGFTADLLEAGLDRSSALAVAASASGKPSFQRAARHLAANLHGQGTVTRVDDRPLPATVAHALRAELTTASRVRLLRAICESYAERTGVLLSWSRGLAAPLATCVIGLFVGLLVIGLFLPLISLVEGLSG